MSDHSQTHSHGTMSQLMIGFAMAVVLTLVPFALVMSEVEMNRTLLIGIIMGLGGVQIIVHLVYFLHLNSKSEQGWSVAATIFAVVILVIVLAGSLWVMHNMNVNMMPPMDHETMMGGEGVGLTPETSPAMDHSNMPGMTHSTTGN
ncbi:MAG TPA: cytochrome o ubiquinol oxidase subunit IV [Paenirhodobacter sp.]